LDNFINFDSVNFDFSSLTLNTDSITFDFKSNPFDFSSMTSRDSLSFELYKTKTERFDFDSMLSFEASSVTFENSSVTFKYKPNSVNFRADLFTANANLFDYKLSSSDFQKGVSFKQFNASDFRALQYAFNGDELFNTKYYLDKKVTPIGMNPFTDYVENGYLAGVDPNPLFDISYYLDTNTDVRNARVEPLKHYSLFGYTENHQSRDPNALFDTSYYNEKNPDVVNAKMNPLLHYIQSGYKENLDSRDPNPFFDSSYYLAKNPDVAKAGVNPLQHYIEFGWRESLPNNPKGTNPNRDPNPLFDTSFYFETHIDVRNEAVFKNNPNANPLQHYLEFGNSGRFANENRITHPLFVSPNLLEFTTTIDANSEGFAFVQNEFAKLNYQLTPREDGGILIASKDPTITEIFVEALKYSIFVGATLVKLSLDLAWEVATDTTFSSYSFSPANFGTPPFPSETETKIQVTPGQDSSLEDILNPDGKEKVFWTPLEPVNANSPTSFPQRNEILETLLDGGLFLGGEEIPQGTYFLGVEIIIETDSYEQARNRALEELGEINPATRTSYIGKLGVGKGKTVGFTTTVDGVFKRFRVDYDPVKGPHINVEVGKGQSRKKFGVKFPGTEADVEKILEELQE
jgi:hypothetical protein